MKRNISIHSSHAGVYEGGETTGYFRFEISKDDPAPYLVYTPLIFGDDKVWITLK